MTVTELVKLAGESEPELMAQTTLMLKLAERLAPELAPDVVAEFKEIADHASEKAKTAGLKDFAKSVGTGAAASIAGSVAVGLGLAVATDLYNSARRGLTSGRNWKRMMDANPHLREKEIGEVRRNFHALQRTAPDVASDPLAAGAAMFNLMNAPEGRYSAMLSELAKMQKERVESQYKPFASGPKVEVKTAPPLNPSSKRP